MQSMEPDGTIVLSRQHMEAQLSIIELLIGMFPEPGELDIPPETLRWTKTLSDWCSESQSHKSPAAIPPELSLALNLTVGEDSSVGTRHILLNISVPTRCADIDALEPPPLRYFFRQPDWLSKAQVLEFSSSIPQNDIFEAIEWVREEAPERLMTRLEEATIGAEVSNDILVRVWFYFPSLSTREKRDDIVNFAPAYHLTGFVLAGKPGVLCLEGTTGNIDAYMKFIKTHSWGDIPSHQKKVSERYRESRLADGDTLGIQRVFDGMEEITGVLGDRGGARANRGDMKALEIWLKDKGLGEAFEKVIF
jgi:hypothetical protein